MPIRNVRGVSRRGWPVFFLGATLFLLLAWAPGRAEAQTLEQGPFDRLVIRGVIVIDGTGGPPRAGRCRRGG